VDIWKCRHPINWSSQLVYPLILVPISIYLPIGSHQSPKIHRAGKEIALIVQEGYLFSLLWWSYISEPLSLFKSGSKSLWSRTAFFLLSCELGHYCSILLISSERLVYLLHLTPRDSCQLECGRISCSLKGTKTLNLYK
jgi:hypothetical protein